MRSLSDYHDNWWKHGEHTARSCGGGGAGFGVRRLGRAISGARFFSAFVILDKIDLARASEWDLGLHVLTTIPQNAHAQIHVTFGNRDGSSMRITWITNSEVSDSRVRFGDSTSSMPHSGVSSSKVCIRVVLQLPGALRGTEGQKDVER
jgi:hypothetical protein